MTWLLPLCAVLVPVLPGLAWLWLIYRTDHYEPEPKRWVALTFGLGVFSILPAFGLERLAEVAYPYLGAIETASATSVGQPVDPWPLVIASFLFIGPAEELCKFLTVRLVMFRHREFDEPLDGIIYSSAAALGFASLENIFYVVDLSDGVHLRWGLLGVRAFLALPGHVLFAAMWGSALGRHKFDPRRPVWPSLLLAAALHGLYDFILLYPVLRPCIILYMTVLVPIVLRQIRLLREDSPFAPGALGPAVLQQLPLAAPPASPGSGELH